jgi:membrane-associated phospholipid phosphatase
VGVTSSVDRGAPEAATWRSAIAGPVIAVATVVCALVATDAAGVRFQDWQHAVAERLKLVAFVVALLVVIDIAARAASRSRRLLPSRTALRSVREERWPLRRAVAVASTLVTFYVTYLAYRNIKSAVPLVRPGELFDRQLTNYDRALFGGNDPAALLHSLLGTGIAAEALAVVYVGFFYFVVVSLPLALVFAPSPRGGIFYVNAVAFNWVLGAMSYLLLPARGPIYYEHSGFSDLPSTRVSHLQGVLLRQRAEFLADPTNPHLHQGIGAFASLHTSILFTAAIATHMLGLDRRLRIGVWILFALTTIATVYFGWHYVLDDLAGMVMGVAALGLARALTGFKSRTLRRPRIPKRAHAPGPAGAATQPVASIGRLEASVAETSSGGDAP